MEIPPRVGLWGSPPGVWSPPLRRDGDSTPSRTVGLSPRGLVSPLRRDGDSTPSRTVGPAPQSVSKGRWGPITRAARGVPGDWLPGQGVVQLPTQRHRRGRRRTSVRRAPADRGPIAAVAADRARADRSPVGRSLGRGDRAQAPRIRRDPADNLARGRQMNCRQSGELRQTIWRGPADAPADRQQRIWRGSAGVRSESGETPAESLATIPRSRRRPGGGLQNFNR